MDQEEGYVSELADIKLKLYDIHNDIKHFFSVNSAHNTENIIRSLKDDYSGLIVSHLIADAGRDLDKNMIKKCDMRGECKNLLADVLQKNASLIKEGKVSESSIEQNRLELKKLRNMVTYEKCDVCFKEASDIMSRQISLMRSMRIYETNSDMRQDVSTLVPDIMVDDILDPLCHRKRLEIMKAIFFQSQSFSSLSNLTGLRGGNLLFHIQKLIDKGMIIQPHDRGDYMITGKGFKLMEGLSGIYNSYVGSEEASRANFDNSVKGANNRKYDEQQ